MLAIFILVPWHNSNTLNYTDNKHVVIGSAMLDESLMLEGSEFTINIA